jgi:starvation-inducible outer membrane lipoprotein
MKPLCLALLAACAFGLAGCVTETTKTRTVQNSPDPTTTRVHTQEELRKSGESQTGPALEKTDPAITASGPR